MAHVHYYFNETTINEEFSLSSRLLYTGVVRDDPKWGSRLHSHAFCEILYVLTGEGSVAIDGAVYPIAGGDLVVLNQGAEHEEKTDTANPLHFVFLAMDSFCIPGFKENCLIATGQKPVICTGKYRYKIESYFSDLIRETDSRVGYYECISRGLAQAIAVLILRIGITEGGDLKQMSSACRRVKEYIDLNYTAGITLETLSETVYISKHHLAHLFKSQTGLSPIQYLINRRIDESCRLLRQTELSIAEIAKQVGYENAMYFSQLFKKAMHMSPMKYRNANRER